EGQKPRTPGHILSIESTNPVFHLALQAALSALRVPFDGSQSCGAPNGVIRVRGVAVRSTPTFGDGFPIARPAISLVPGLNEAPPSPRNGYVSTAEYLRRYGLPQYRAWRLFKDGKLKGFGIVIGRRKWLYVVDAPVTRLSPV